MFVLSTTTSFSQTLTATLLATATAGGSFFLTVTINVFVVLFPDLLNVAVNVTFLSSTEPLNTVPFNAVTLTLLDTHPIATPGCPVKLETKTKSPKTLSLAGFPFNSIASVKAALALLTANSSKSTVPSTTKVNCSVLLTAPLDTVAVKVIGVSKLGLITLPAVSIKLAFEEPQFTATLSAVNLTKLRVVFIWFSAVFAPCIIAKLNSLKDLFTATSSVSPITLNVLLPEKVATSIKAESPP